MRHQTAGQRASQQIHANAPCLPTELNRIPNLRSFADPDKALVEGLKAQTPAAFDELVKRYGRHLLTVAMRITKNREDAEDAVQEAFLKVFKKIVSFRGASKFATWLTRVAINQALMLIRGNTQDIVSIDEGTERERARTLEITAGGDTPEQLCAQREFEVVMLNLKNVRKSCRQVMHLRVKHDLSDVEIAQILNLTISAVKARLYRGRLDLRKASSRSLDLAKLARGRKSMSTTIGKSVQRRFFIGASALAGGNLLPARPSQSSSKLLSYLPYHFAPQLLTRPHNHDGLAAPKLPFDYTGADEALKNERCP